MNECCNSKMNCTKLRKLYDFVLCTVFLIPVNLCYLCQVIPVSCSLYNIYNYIYMYPLYNTPLQLTI